MAESKKAVKEELNLDTKVSIKSIADCLTGFSRIESVGDVSIPPNGTYRLSRSEIIAQVQNGNVLFCGIDGQGSHATIFIDDKPTRIEVGFDSEDGKRSQAIFSEQLVKDIFNKKNQAEFESAFKEAFKTRAERRSVMAALKKLGINDYAKIKFAEDYTGHKLQ